ncbi:unnamed protein product, partial [Discosporangium mesarthrocarpum]
MGYLPWVDNARLSKCCRVLRDGNLNGQWDVSWIQIQSKSETITDIVNDLAKPQVSSSGRPNLAILAVDSQVVPSGKGALKSSLYRQLYLAELVPWECPILAVESTGGVFGGTITVGDPAHFSCYDGVDVEENPSAAVTTILIVAHIPPEIGFDPWCCKTRKSRSCFFTVAARGQLPRNAQSQPSGPVPIKMQSLVWEPCPSLRNPNKYSLNPLSAARPGRGGACAGSGARSGAG